MRTRDAAMTVSAIVCAFADRRWPDLVAAVESLREQSCPVGEVVVVIDHNPALLERAQRELAGARTVRTGTRAGFREPGTPVSRLRLATFCSSSTTTPLPSPAGSTQPDRGEHLLPA
jgi:hypothetical protein